jgi:predicted DNA-binding protein
VTRREPTYDTMIRFPAEWEQRIRAWSEHHGSVNAAVNKAVMEAVLAFEGEDTTRVRVRQIQADVTELKEMVKLSNAVAFTGLNAIELLHTVSDKDKAWVEQQIDKVKG